jgi:hypothetical protein
MAFIFAEDETGHKERAQRENPVKKRDVPTGGDISL